MSDIKLPQGSDYHGNGKYYSKENKDMIIARLEEKVKELETELYFYNRNKRVGELVDERTKMETPKIKM